MKDNNWAYLFGKLAKAIEVLVTNTGDTRNRVWGASEYLLMLSPESVPESCKEDVRWIHRMLTRYAATGYYKSRLHATYHRTRNSTASKIARRAWKLYHLMGAEVDEYLKHKECPVVHKPQREHVP